MENIKSLFQYIKPIIQEFHRGDLQYGKLDCNLLFMKIYEPEKYDELYGRYTTTLGGARVAKKIFGHPSIKSFLTVSDQYEIVKSSDQIHGDIIVYDTHDIYIVIDSKWFGVIKEDKFGLITPMITNDYEVYRKRT